MGYSLYFQLTPEQRRQVEAFFDEKGLPILAGKDGDWTRFNGQEFDIRGPLFDFDDLSYRNRRHKYTDVFGVDYVGGDYAPALVNWMASKLGVTTYWYDGQEKFEVKSPWWEKPAGELDEYQRGLLALPRMSENFKCISRALRALDAAWDDFNTTSVRNINHPSP